MMLKLITKKIINFYQKLGFIQGVIFTVAFTSALSIAAANIPGFFIFSAGTPISSAQINSNFEKLANLIDNGRSQNYVGAWDVNSNSPEIETTSPIPGDYYIVSTAGAHTFTDGESFTFAVGDWIIYNGMSWEKLHSSSWNYNANNAFYNSGKVGIGTSNPQTKLDVNGALKLGSDTLTCSNLYAGSIKFNSPNVEYCNGSAWVTFGTGGTGTVTDVSASSPINVTNGTTNPNISISQANTSTSGFLTSADWNIFNNKQDNISPGTSLQYYRGDKTWQTLNTTSVAEGNNLYFTTARAIGASLTGFSIGSNSTINAADDILSAFGKTQGQLNAIGSGFIDWTASGIQTIHPSRLNFGIGYSSKAVMTDANGFITTSNTTSTELNYLSGVTSPLQSQINNKISSQWTTAGANISFTTGNVGVGTSTPTEMLDTVTGANAPVTIKVKNTMSNTGAQAQFVAQDSSTNTVKLGVSSPGVTSGGALGANAAFLLSAATDGLNIATSYSGSSMKFWTGGGVPNERMRIDFSGNIGVGTTAPSYKLDVNGTLNVSGATTNVSDLRFKKEIQKIPNALEKISAIDGVTYKFRNEEFPNRDFSHRREMGVVAQTVEKVFPEAVSKDQNGYRSVAYTMLIAPIIESIKQLSSDFKSTVMRVLYLEERDREKDLLIASIKAENIALKNEFKSQALSHKNENELIMSKLKKIETILKNQ